MLKILIVGSSYSIKDVFSKKYKSEKISYINFRELWKKDLVDHYDKIILSGFHREILYIKMSELDKYVAKYFDLIKLLLSKTDNLILISTYIPKNKSYSRIVYFYYNLCSRAINLEKIKILSFKKIFYEKHVGFIKNIIFKFLNFNFTNPNEIISNIDKFELKKLNKPHFLLTPIPRTVLIERLSRLLDKS